MKIENGGVRWNATTISGIKQMGKNDPNSDKPPPVSDVPTKRAFQQMPDSLTETSARSSHEPIVTKDSQIFAPSWPIYREGKNQRNLNLEF